MPNYKFPNPELFSLQSLADWLRKQPKEEVYDYYDLEDCVIGRYFTDHNFPFRYVGGDFWVDVSGNRQRLPVSFQDVATRSFEHDPYTFGNALIRAERLLSIRQAEHERKSPPVALTGTMSPTGLE